MPRPPKCRQISSLPGTDYFKPRGVPLRDLAETVLSMEGFEALRLTEIEGLDQDQAAARMNVSRQTYGRVLAAARRAVAEAVVQGRALRIEGGHYQVDENRLAACGTKGHGESACGDQAPGLGPGREPGDGPDTDGFES